MTRRIIFIILGALALVLLLIGLWMWFFTGETPGPDDTGSFGSGTERPGGSATGNPDTNIPNNVPNNGSTAGSNNNGIITNISGNAGTQNVSGVQWLGGSGTVLGGGTITNFVPSTINELNNGQVGGNVAVIGGSTNPDNSQNPGLEGALIGAGISVALCTASTFSGASGGILSSAALAPVSVTVNAPVQNVKDANDLVRDNFLNCIARTIARAAIQQITASVVNWINSGFNGKPSFVQNYQQFFTNVADQAVGEFIKGSGLSFLCTPFQNQIRIALAQSYARRNNAPTCSLSSIVRNFTQFTGGTGGFSANGGWKGLISFVGTPTNNPFGAYMYGQSAVANAQATALTNANRQITPTGFLAMQEKYNCKAVVGANGPEQKCQTRITTPGGVIESSLNKTLGTSIDSLNLAKNFDEIISALVTQLMTKALYGGLSNLSGQQGYESSYLTPDQQQAQEQGQALLESLRGTVQYAQQYGSTFQAMIRDVQGAQEQLNSLANCWSVAASSTENTSKQTQANNNTNAAHAMLASYEPTIETYNGNITRANAAIAFLQELQTRTLGVTSTADVKAITDAYNDALAAGTIILPADVTQAQQDRTSLQSQLSARNEQTKTGLQQCYAFGS